MLRFVPALAGREAFGSTDAPSLAGSAAGATAAFGRAEALADNGVDDGLTRAKRGGSSTGCG